jgi:Na+-transporting NADH:ubiquinone oxidoreductase subunit F
VSEILLGALVFTLVVMLLALLILGARRLLLPEREVEIRIGASAVLRARTGERLLAALHAGGVYLPSPCGGRGTCGQCGVRVPAGAGPVLPVERTHLSSADLAAGTRLACQVRLRGDVEVEVPAELLQARHYRCRVRSNRNVTTLMKELEFELPAGCTMEFRPGSYVQVVAPPRVTRFADFEIELEYRAEWDRLGLWRMSVTSDEPQTRAYSIASAPEQRDRIALVVRVATPPPGAGADVPPGIVSSYVFSLREGDEVEVVGPYSGGFHPSDGEREMVLIGGGAGMAPLRSIVLDQLLGKGSERTMSFWYGARNRRELCYAEEFERLAREHPSFSWHVALSEPAEEDAWEGDTGFIHEVVQHRHLAGHPAPAECEFYLCGPPLMVGAALAMLERLGVSRGRIFHDDFGG